MTCHESFSGNSPLFEVLVAVLILVVYSAALYSSNILQKRVFDTGQLFRETFAWIFVRSTSLWGIDPNLIPGNFRLSCFAHVFFRFSNLHPHESYRFFSGKGEAPKCPATDRTSTTRSIRGQSCYHNISPYHKHEVCFYFFLYCWYRNINDRIRGPFLESPGNFSGP